MTGPVLNEERLDRYQPLGAFGQPVYQNHVQLTAALRQRLGARYANFFAVPRLDEGNGRVSWLSPVAGEARRWSDLDEAEHEGVPGADEHVHGRRHDARDGHRQDDAHERAHP